VPDSGFAGYDTFHYTASDGMDDGWELDCFLTADRDGTDDFDGDGLADADEFRIGTDPSAADTDGDGAGDGQEASLGYDPLDPASTPPIDDTTGGGGSGTSCVPFRSGLPLAWLLAAAMALLYSLARHRRCDTTHPGSYNGRGHS
jgi:hypothetical protein